MVTELRVIVLIASVIAAVICITWMSKRTSEIKAWAFITLAVGCAWRLAAVVNVRLLPDESVNEDIGALVVGVGILLVCIDELYYGACARMRALLNRRRISRGETPL